MYRITSAQQHAFLKGHWPMHLSTRSIREELMILNHLWGLYGHPQDELHSIDQEQENLIYSVSHILIIALIPTICTYFSAVYLGWHINLGEVGFVAPLKALIASVVVYALMIGGVFVFAFTAWRLAVFMKAPSTFNQSVELSSYASTPLFMTGFCAVYPETWFIVVFGCIGLGYSAYLLFSGVTILIHVDIEKRRTYALALVACGLVILIGLIGVMMWIYRV
jgi:hypothetical protein